MQDQDKNKEQLIAELDEMRRKVSELQAAQSILVDIAELEQAVKDLGRKTEEQTLLLNTIDTQIWCLTDPGTYGLVNQSRADFLGKRREEIEGKRLHDFYSQDVANVCKAGNAEVFQSRRTICTEEWIPNAAGEVKLISITKTPKLDEHGNLESVVCAGTDITERKRTEETLRESEQKYRSIFENSPVGIFHSTVSGKLIEVNAAFARILKYDSPEELIAKVNETSIADALYIKPDKRPRIVQGARSKFGQWVVTENQYRGKDGSVITGVLYFREINSTGDRPGTLEGFVEDITERKHVEEELRESEDRHRSLVEHLPQRIFIKDLNSVYLSCNGNYASDLGITPEEIVGKDDFAFHSSELAQMYRSDDQDCIATDTVKDTEKPYQLNGQERWAHAIKVPYHDSQGRIIGVLGIFEDITERKRAEEDLRESEQRFRRVFEQGPVGMAMVSLNYRWLAVNHRLCEITGYSSEELAKLSFVDITHPDDIAQDVAQAEALARGDIPYHQMQKRYIKKNKEIAWINLTATIIRNNQNEPMYFLSMMEDVTARKKSEREEEFLRNQLFQSQKMEALGTLVGGIAHDFNNMLQIMIGYCDLLLDDKKKGEPGYRELQAVIETGKGGADLVKKMLAFSQQGQVFPVPLDLNLQIRELIPLISRTLPQLVKIDFDLTDGLMAIHTDPNQIDQVVMNLAINASEAMSNGGRLKVATKTVSLDDEYRTSHPGVKPGEYVMLSVKDNGRGMDKETLAKAFDPFFSTKQRGSTKGTGLGLSVAQGIVQQQGGHITCESEPGRGTEFKVYFPAIEAPLMTPKTVAPTIKSGGAETILVVEDTLFVAELEEQILANAGYTVIMATRRQEALDIYGARKDEISLVILDLIMPEMSARDCLKELLKIDPSVKVLIASGFSPSDELHREISPLVKGFMRKPFTIAELLNEARSVLDGD